MIEAQTVSLIYTTFPDRKTAEEICQRLLQDGLIACANIGAEMSSLYLWKGLPQKETEIPVLLKTTENRVAALTERLKGLHPFENPCILSLRVDGGSMEFLNWIRGSVS